VPETIAGLEVILPYETVMGHMAGIAVCYTPVGTMRPCGKLRGHDVAIDAHPWIIGEIGGSVGNLQEIKE